MNKSKNNKKKNVHEISFVPKKYLFESSIMINNVLFENFLLDLFDLLRVKTK